MFKFFQRKKKTLLVDLGTRKPVEQRTLESLHLDVPASLMDEIFKNLSNETKDELPEQRKPKVKQKGGIVLRGGADRKPSVMFSDHPSQVGARRRITKREFLNYRSLSNTFESLIYFITSGDLI